MGKRPTIQMVADLAGVSRGTVDRVLNERSYVSSVGRERVMAAIMETGYISPRDLHRKQLGAVIDKVKVGVLLPNWEGQFRTETNKGITRAVDELENTDIEVLVRRCETDIPQEVLRLLDELIDQGVAGLAICTLDDPSIQQYVSKQSKAGMPCITFNSDLSESGRLCFVGQDIHKSGRVAGELMSKCVSKDDVVLATLGNLKFDGHRQRLNGFWERMMELGFPRENLVVAETFNDYHTTFSTVKDTIEGNPNLRGIYLANLSVSACAEAVRLSGKKGIIHIICHDYNESVRRMLIDGSVDFTIPQDMVEQGRLPLILLRDYLVKGQVPNHNRANGKISVLCAENLPD